jgi:hypothetical protein
MDQSFGKERGAGASEGLPRGLSDEFNQPSSSSLSLEESDRSFAHGFS